MKLNKYQLFFQAAYLKFAKYIFDKGEEDIKPLLDQQNKDMKTILSEVSNIMLIYNIQDNIMNMSESDQKKEKARFDKVIANSFKSQYRAEEKQITSILNEVGQNKYNSNSYLFTLDSKNKRKRLNTEELKKIIGQKVEGANYSERLWADKNQVASSLQKEIKKFLQGKTSVNDIQEVIQKKFSANDFNTRRIVTSEIARVQSAISDKWCEENGVEFQLFSVVLDGVTSKTCRSHANDNPYRVNDPGKPIPPLHPFCRSTLIPITPEGYRPNIPKDDVGWNEYEKWNQNGSVIRNDNKESNNTSYEKVVSNVKWSNYTNISEDNSKMLNEIHTSLNAFMIEHHKEKLSLLGLSDNKVFIEQIGDKEEIKLSKETVRILKEGNANDIIFTHNHPGKTTFSRDDIEKIVTYESINSLTLECEDGSKYIIQRGTCKSSNVKGYLFYNKYENIRRKVAKNYPELEDDLKIYEVWDDYMNEVAETVCNKYGLIYKKVK